MLRRGRLVLLSVVVGAATTFAALPGQAETLRTGLARGQLARIVPYVGIPSVGAGMGIAQAEISGASARATAGVADFGMMSMILDSVASKAPVPLPALPGPITADDRDHPDVERNPLAPPSSPPVPAEPAGTAPPAPAREEAHASEKPESRARVRGPEAGVPGVLTLTGGESRASADGGVSSSTVTLGRLVLGGGGVPEVVLSDLVWTARHEMGQPGTASFSVGTVAVAGQALPIPAGAPPADVVETVNHALEPAGLRLEVPAVLADGAGATVSSLVLQVRNPETVAGLLASATEPAVPVLNQMLDTLLEAAPDASAARLVVNALLATGTTRGGGRLELGGASARIGNTEVADLPKPVLPPVAAVEPPPGFPPPVAADSAPPSPAPPEPPAPASFTDPASGFGHGGSSYESSAPAPAAPTAPSGAARTPDAAAAPDGSTLAARSVGSTAPGGAPAPLVLGAALVVIAILALGDKLRLRRLTGEGAQ